MSALIHKHYMRHALAIARSGLGRMGSTRPSVGCVLVKDGIIIAAARTGDHGKPHAEAAALDIAADSARGAAAYVTLEPCAHHGATPPCANALVKAGIEHCIIGCLDPFPEVNGKGIAILKNAGITVTTGVLEQECQRSHAGFFLNITDQRPYVTLKMAMSADHKIAITGQRTQISGPDAHRYTHLLRSLNDAILVGKNTATIDQPALTTRLPGYHHEIKKFTLDDEHFTTPRDLKSVLAQLAEQGITRLLVEGGAQTATSFLASGYIDEAHIITAPHTIGAQGLDALHGHPISDLESQFEMKKQKTRRLGEDSLAIYTRKA